MYSWTIDSFGIENLKLVERPNPQPGPGQILLGIKAVSLNYRDLLMIKGLYNPRLTLPRIPCSDGAGEVLAIGAGVNRVKVGDRVVTIFMQKWFEGALLESMAKSALGGEIDGTMTEQILLSEEGVVPIPQHLNYEEAATLPCAAVTSWNALAGSELIAGNSVLLQGTGGVSIFALQLAKVMGMRILITSSSDVKLARAKQLEADETLNYRTSPDWDKWARSQTDNIGVDHVIEVGGSGTLEKSFKAVRTGGRISLIGILSGTGPINPMPILMRSLQVQGIFVGSRAMFESMNKALQLHQIKPIIDRTFPFREFPEALRYLESGSHFGKIVLRIES